jgi:hypothetical protein
VIFLRLVYSSCKDLNRSLFVLFQSVINFAAATESENSYAFNVAVGKKPTTASFYVDDASDVREVLVALSGDKSLRQRQASSTGLVPIQDFFA